MKVFLTGGTGFVGHVVATRLAADGHDLVCLVRDAASPRAQELFNRCGAQLAPGDVTDARSVEQAAAGCDVAVHLVGIIFEPRGSSFEQVHVHGTQNVLAACQAHGIARVLHMSALGSGPDATSGYHRSKWLAEEAVRASGLDFTIFRPSIIYGPGGEFLQMLVRQVRLLPFVPVVGSGDYRLQPVSVDDVASCFAAALGSAASQSTSRTYDIGGPRAVSYNDMVDILCCAMGRRRARLHIPVAIMRLVALASEKMMTRPLLTRDQLDMLLKDNVCDIGRMRRELGVEPVGLEEGLRGMMSS